MSFEPDVQVVDNRLNRNQIKHVWNHQSHDLDFLILV